MKLPAWSAVLAPAALPVMRRLPAELAHDLTLRALEAGMAPAAPPADDPILKSENWGRCFVNPIGLAAGFDKNALAPDALLRWGFGFVEIGTVTPRPQSGNPKPRLFRLTADGAIINRMGFNNAGLNLVAQRLAARDRQGLVGANLGKNRDSSDAFADYCQGVARLAALADYLVVNVSSPNTPGLRDLQKRTALRTLLDAVIETRNNTVTVNPPPLLLKIAPDLTAEEAADIAATSLEAGVDGLIISNTTTARPPLRSAHAPEPGGLSGLPLMQRSTALLREMFRLTGGTIPLIGVGGVASGADAYAKIRAGASLVQLYTALTLHGPGLISRIKTDLVACLRRDGFDSIRAAIGVDGRSPAGAGAAKSITLGQSFTPKHAQ